MVLLTMDDTLTMSSLISERCLQKPTFIISSDRRLRERVLESIILALNLLVIDGDGAALNKDVVSGAKDKVAEAPLTFDALEISFRERQKRLGINSEKDYPPTTDPFHQPNRVMDKLTPEKTNIEGYSNSFTRYIYQYAPAPTCANRCGRSYNAPPTFISVIL
jgi:hypothetical protein